jgi:arylsulfatase A-like enzyme
MGVMEPGDSSVSRAPIGSKRLVESWLLGTAIVGTLEWTLLVAQQHDAFRSGRQIVFMLGFELGNFLPYVLLASLLWTLCDALRGVLARKLRRPELALLSGAFLLALPYAGWLAAYTFSGPQARTLPLRVPAIVFLAVLLGLTFASAVWLHLRAAGSSKTWWRGAGFCLASLVVLWINVTFLPNEYEPIHSFLGGWAILFATLAANHFTIASSAFRLSTLRAKASLATVGSVWCFGSAFILARANDYAWLLWSETGSSRYVTARLTMFAPDAEVRSEKLGPFRPNVESEATRRDRARRRAARAPHIVIFSIDGLRTDHVGAYGYKKHPTTPNIDRFAQRGVRFTHAYSHYPKTQNFNSALLFGRFVPIFGAHDPPRAYQQSAMPRLLDGRGYHILVKSWFEHSTKNRFDPTDYRIDTSLPKPKNKRRMEEPMEERLEVIATHLDQARAKDEPAFVWLHLLGTHLMPGRFVPHPDYPFGEERMDLYDSAIAGSDLWLLHLERLMAERASTDRPTIWVLTSDHGIKENSGTRDLSHGVVHVPFIVVAPGLAPRVEGAPVDVALDLAATVVDWAGVEPPAEYEGVSLVPALGGDEKALAAMRERVMPLAHHHWTGAIYGRFKYLKHGDAVSLFDIEADPEEKRNLVGEQTELVRSLGGAAEKELARRTNRYRGRKGASPTDDQDDDDDGHDGEN